MSDSHICSLHPCVCLCLSHSFVSLPLSFSLSTSVSVPPSPSLGARGPRRRLIFEFRFFSTWDGNGNSDTFPRKKENSVFDFERQLFPLVDRRCLTRAGRDASALCSASTAARPDRGMAGVGERQLIANQGPGNGLLYKRIVWAHRRCAYYMHIMKYFVL